MDDAARSGPVSGARIGHVHLRVADLDRAVVFYRDLLGFEVQQLVPGQIAFLGADGYHHHVALNVWASRGATPPPAGHTGLFHAAILYPNRAALGQVVARLLAAGVRLTGASDHGVSEAVYLDDPDANGLELYRDRELADWPRDADGGLAIHTRRLDLGALLGEAGPVG